MAQRSPPMPISPMLTPTSETPTLETPRVRRIVCGWNEENETFIYRDEVKAPPPLASASSEMASMQPKVASVKARISGSADVEFSPTKSKLSNVSSNGLSRMEKLRRERAFKKGKKLIQSHQPSPRSTPSLEAGRRSSQRRAASHASHVSHATNSEEEAEDENPTLEEPVYVVPDHLQSTISPVPRPINHHHIPWKDLQNTRVPLPNDPMVQITGFDNIMVTTISEDKNKPHNEPAKVLDCRLHPNGTYFLLVSWWFQRRSLTKSLVGFKSYLDRRWPPDAPYQFILGCHFDVITSDTIMEKLPDDERFCNTMMYGGIRHNCEIFSDIPDEIERRDSLKKGGNQDERRKEERQQKGLYRLLFPPPL